MSGSFESVRWNTCVHRLHLGLYSHPKDFLGTRVRTHVNSKGRKSLDRKKFSSEEDRTHDAARYFPVAVRTVSGKGSTPPPPQKKKKKKTPQNNNNKTTTKLQNKPKTKKPSRFLWTAALLKTVANSPSGDWKPRQASGCLSVDPRGEGNIVRNGPPAPTVGVQEEGERLGWLINSLACTPTRSAPPPPLPPLSLYGLPAPTVGVQEEGERLGWLINSLAFTPTRSAKHPPPPPKPLCPSSPLLSHFDLSSYLLVCLSPSLPPLSLSLSLSHTHTHTHTHTYTPTFSLIPSRANKTNAKGLISSSQASLFH